MGTRGISGTFGVPGTGMYYTKEHRWRTGAPQDGAQARHSAQTPDQAKHGLNATACVIIGFFVAGIAELITGSAGVFVLVFIATSFLSYRFAVRGSSQSVPAPSGSQIDQRIAKPKPQDIVADTRQIAPIFPEFTVAGGHSRRSIADAENASFEEQNVTREKELRLALQTYKWILFTVEAVHPANRVLQSIHELMLSTARDYVLATEMALDSIAPMHVEKRQASNAILDRASETLGQ